MSWVHVKHDKPTCRPGDDANVRVRPLLPPLANLVSIARRILETTRCPGMFSSRFAVGVTTGAFSVADAVQGEHKKTASRIPQGRF